MCNDLHFRRSHPVTGVGIRLTVFRWPWILAAFLLFRLLDITKPGPIRWLDRRVGGGLGVVLDDVAAGAVGCLILHGARWALRGMR